MKCLECGSDVLLRDPKKHGIQPKLCSLKCQTLRRRKTTKAWVKRNRARKAALDAEHRKRFKQDNPDYFREYYAQKKEQRKRESREWYQANTAYAIERQKVYVATRPIELRRAIGRRNRARRRARELQVFVETVDARVVFERDKGICGICGEAVEMSSTWEVDHIVPLVKGGTHCYANVQLAHRRCNRSKGTKCDESLQVQRGV